MATQYKTGRHNVNLNTTNTSLARGNNSIALEEVLTPSNIILQIDHEAEARVNVAPALVSVPAPGFTVRAVSEPVPNQVTLHGPRSLLGRYNVVYTEERELTNLRSNVTITLPLETPHGYGLWLDPDSVRISLEVVPVKTRTFKDVPIVVYNSPVNRNVTLDPSTVDIELTGPPSEIDLLNVNAIAASVDFQERSPLQQARVKVDVPSRYQLRDVDPDSVTISFE
jgi:YbbR domain-containing protein